MTDLFSHLYGGRQDIQGHLIVLCRQTSSTSGVLMFWFFLSIASLFDLLDLLPDDFFWSHFTCSSADKVKCHIVNPAFVFCLFSCASFSFYHPPPPPSFQHHPSSPCRCPSLLAPRCPRVATPRHRHWPRPLRRPKSNILTCLLPEWWFIKKLSWLRKKIDWHR